MYNNSQNCRGFVYVVKEGDTLYKIARDYDLKLIDVLRYNPYVNVYNLQVGDELCLPTLPNSAVPGGSSERTYITQEGDTMVDLLRLFDTDFDDLAEYNPSLWELPIPAGFVLRYPVKAPR
ncbi:MAG: LysM peptidoglycan-binding domain-containing protein [Lachnospiraceae bacterium]|nr:LysM peptidoglycan-binding domain-containing protein [Lachnospiraceae bacterium]MBP3507184.1 LysM peptidoglycan-binding domain-containing protein [Lachnospiraceae bacterium]